MIVAVVEGSILRTRPHQDREMTARQFDYLKAHLRQCLIGRGAASHFAGILL
jgi:hypothetical protein